MNNDFADHLYCYDGTEILINKFDLKDIGSLKRIERTLTAARLIQLSKKPVSGSFDAAHLKKIHMHIFQDIYPWAGQFRRVDISKGALFCHAAYIPHEINKLLLKLKQDNYLKNLSFDDLVPKVAFYLSEINAIHPFRDGNGRTQREFIRELLIPLNYHVDYSKIEPDFMLQASISSFNGDIEMMSNLFRKCIVPLR